jgi:hypothetical protein
MRPQHCGNAGRLTPGDRAVIDRFRAFLTESHTAEQEGRPMPDPADYFGDDQGAPATVAAYEQGRHDQAAGTVDTTRTADRAYVRGLADQRTADIDAELTALPSTDL